MNASQHHRHHVAAMNCQDCVANMRRAILSHDADAEVGGEPSEKRLDVTIRLDGQGARPSQPGAQAATRPAAPQRAVIRDGEEFEVALDEVREDDRLRVRSRGHRADRPHRLVVLGARLGGTG